MTLPFLATGCGKSATMWAAALFTRLGYPTVHEQQFSPTSSGPLRVPEVSWHAIPFLGDLPAGTPLLRIVRNPHDVVISALGRGFLAQVNTPHERFVAEHRPWIIEPADHLGRVIRWVATWDDPVADHAHMVLQPDQQSTVQIAAAVGYATGRPPGIRHLRQTLADVGKVHASRRKRSKAARAQIDAHPEVRRINERAQTWGYT